MHPRQRVDRSRSICLGEQRGAAALCPMQECVLGQTEAEKEGWFIVSRTAYLLNSVLAGGLD